VVVTGGSGKLGRACVRDLVDHGYDVVNVDLVPPLEALCPFVQADLEDFGQALEVCAGVDDRHGRVDAVVHLAAIPAPGMRPERGDLPPQHAEHLQRLRGGAPPRDPQRRVGVERDGARAAVRHAAARDPARRVPPAAA
jgi:NAD(P)-dependent dehydrogenase (short-subunit alcohol dehydrogenase family)